MAYIKSGTNASILKRMLRNLGAALLLLPMLASAGELLLGEEDVAAKVTKEPTYQLLDARGVAARQTAPLAFSTKYEKLMPVNKGLVFVVADSDAAALEIAQSIPASSERSVFAVKGGADAWKRVQSKSVKQVKTDFVVPKGTCEIGKPSLEIEAKHGNKSGAVEQKADKK
ncbi:MAG: hypothetical protein A2Z95_03080 [Gallionellales bacterium GWA2_60_18]|nr:MAG: hypothetical protein A2Z95_03080 [Gallionellales bacterium GWA2_60_18]